MYKSIASEGDARRCAYRDGISDLLARLNREGYEKRDDFFPPKHFFERLETYREEYRRMLGLDLLEAETCAAPVMELVAEEESCCIYRLTVRVTAEVPMYALFFMPSGVEKAPLIVAQHGGGGTPELCADMIGKNNYNHMVRRLLARGAAVLAPQLLLWNYKEESETQRKHPIPYDRVKTDHELKRFGLSITALEIKGIMNAITYLSALPFVDEGKIGMTGISYGGYFALHTAAADPRIKAVYAMACFNDRNVYSWYDWCYKGSACTFQDAEVAALCAPRKLFVSLGKADAVFDYQPAIAEAERAKRYFEACGCSENFVFDLWNGGHTMRDDDLGVDFLLSALK
ncbi:MAG: acetylxylan esterase [Clostridia bacterium]|nr:acetylxylan esterase [Clostridia bacterium]